MTAIIIFFLCGCFFGGDFLCFFRKKKNLGIILKESLISGYQDKGVKQHQCYIGGDFGWLKLETHKKPANRS